MNVWITLLRREWWEHKAGLGRTPLVIAGLVVLLALYLLGPGGGMHVDVSASTQSGDDALQRTFGWNDALLHMLDFSSWSTPELERYLGYLLHFVAQPFVYAHFLVAMSVLAGALNNDRRDRSVLFWKSMPVSDLQTVTSKLVLVVWVAPVVTIAAIVGTWIAVLALISVFADTGPGFGQLWAHAGVTSSALAFVTGYLLQGLWMLPLYAWLLLVSAAVPRVPLVWATLAPLVPAFLERLLLGSNRLWDWMSAHMQFAALPRPEALLDSQGPAAIGFPEQLALLLTPDLWVGVAVGVALLAGARMLRARSNDL